MRSKAVDSFWEGYRRLPPEIRKRARERYQHWIRDPRHPSLHFKKVGCYWSARVGGGYRTVGIMDEDVVVWFFIGTHDEYMQLLAEVFE